jgi:dethiobiotin synthetase
MKRLLVTGTDTGVGKTVVSALLCAALDAMYWKPVQTGSREGTDRETVRRLAALAPGDEIPETYLLPEPVSPHLAAKWNGVHIRLEAIRKPSIPETKWLIVEGAGGVLVPLNDTDFMVDLMKFLAFPVVLVTRTSLGTINHTLLSLEALRRRSIAVAGIVLNGGENRDNREALERYGRVPILGWVPPLPEISREKLRQVFEAHFDKSHFTI